MDKIIAGIVTHNRKNLLLECLQSLSRQTYALSAIVVVDNASDDGTTALLEEKGYLNKDSFVYKRMEKNLGGAGGFCEVLSIIRKANMICDWIWLMDDDTIPRNNCLEELIVAHQRIESIRENNQRLFRPISYLASTIYGEDGACMNVPNINMQPAKNGYAYWCEMLEDGMVGISSATFVSILINHNAVEKCGLPCKEYFIWGDDIEYTTRLTRFYGDAFLVGSSKAIHKRRGSKNLFIEDDDIDTDRIKMFFYKIRNEGINARYYSMYRHPVLKNLIAVIKAGSLIRRKNGWIKFLTSVRGNVSAITQYNHFRKYIDKQLNI